MWPPGDSLSQILTRAEQGDVTATNQLLEQHRAALLRMVRARLDRRVARRVDASDVVQDVMVEASRRLPDFLESRPMPFGTWLRQLARDQIIDMYRRHRGAARRSLDREQSQAGLGIDGSSLDLIGRVIDPELTPAAASMRREFEAQFEAALEQLTEEDREIILMRDVEQIGNAEAAELLGLSPPAAGMRHLRALRKLKDLLTGGADG